mgnify:CR=1 FL=1
MTTRTKPRPSLGVDWHLPNPKGGFYKRPFASTTVASADLIDMVAGDCLTWREVAAAIRYDPEARDVAMAFVEAGYGDDVAREILAGRW